MFHGGFKVTWAIPILTCSLSVRSLATELKKYFLISRDFFLSLALCQMLCWVLGIQWWIRQARSIWEQEFIVAGIQDRGDKYQEMRMEMSVWKKPCCLLCMSLSRGQKECQEILWKREKWEQICKLTDNHVEMNWRCCYS